jgi:hypothetical protein
VGRVKRTTHRPGEFYQSISHSPFRGAEYQLIDRHVRSDWRHRRDGHEDEAEHDVDCTAPSSIQLSGRAGRFVPTPRRKNAMPHHPELIRLLVAAAATRNGVSAHGEMYLTEAQAYHLRACEFRTAAAGWWKAPPLPPDLVRAYALPAHLANGWSPPRPTSVAALPAPPATAPNLSRYRRAPPFVRLQAWLTHSATMDQRRVLGSLCRYGDACLAKRRLQQHLHRLPAARLNDALDRLVKDGLVTRDHGWLSLPADVRGALRQAGFGVSRPVQPRAQADHAASGRTHARRARRRMYYEGRDGCLHVIPALVHGRRSLPPVGTSAWGRAMLAKRGGLACQRQCRVLGINPTAEATAARLVRRAAARTKTASPVVLSTMPARRLPAQPLSGRYRRPSGDVIGRAEPSRPTPTTPVREEVLAQPFGADDRSLSQWREAGNVSYARPPAGQTRLGQVLARMRPVGRAERLRLLRGRHR